MKYKQETRLSYNLKQITRNQNAQTSSCDLDFNPMTLIYDLDPRNLMMPDKSELSRSKALTVAACSITDKFKFNFEFKLSNAYT